MPGYRDATAEWREDLMRAIARVRWPAGLAAVAIVAGLSSAWGAAPASSLDIAGNWLHPENGAILEAYDCDGDLCVRIAQASKPGLADEKNPDEAQRARPLDGLIILDHAKANDESSWKGDLYNTQDGNTYSGNVTLLSPAQMQMKGCWLSVFCKTLVFSKVP
jgi:uncharacterized protein (DUF2147 family)